MNEDGVPSRATAFNRYGVTEPPWSNRVFYFGGVNVHARWVGECRCGYSTGILYFDDANRQLRAHTASPACPAFGDLN